MKKFEERWSKIKYFIELVYNYKHKFDNKYMKLRFNSDNNLPIKPELETHNVVITIRSVLL